MKEQRLPARKAAATIRTSFNGTALVGLDERLEVRERLVVIQDSLDQDDDGARFYTAELLEDFDAARADRRWR